MNVECLDAEGASEPGATIDDEENELDGRHRNQLRCRACGNPITSNRDRISVRGEHAHVCVNPAGRAYEIGCFGNAVGWTGVGPRETYWSWFQGFAWQVLECGACGVHLGWRFDGADRSFFGLLLHRLVADASEE